MNGTDANVSGKRKSEKTANLTFVKKANVENKADEEEQDKQQDGNFRCKSLYANLSKDLFQEICKHLSFQEVVNLGRVCWRWYKHTRSPVFWESTDLVRLNLSPLNSQHFLTRIPTCVKNLRIGSCSRSDGKQTLSVPALYNTLHDGLPQLDVLTIENALLTKPGCELLAEYGFMLNTKVPMEQQVRRFYTTMQFRKTVPDADFYALISRLRNITVLSLRSTVLAVGDSSSWGDIRNIPSKIRILDLTLCACVRDKTIQAFCQLPFLEELYLAGTAITINGVSTILSEVRNLKVLDLDDTVVGGETFAVLRKHGQSLVKLYLGNTALRDFDMMDVGEETFPVLEKLCLQRTAVSEIGVQRLLFAVQSLTHIVLTQSKIRITWMWEQPAYIRAKFKYDDFDDNEECNHFLQNEF